MSRLSYKALIASAISILSASAFAFDIQGNISSGTVNWDNITVTHNEMTTSFWGTPPNLPSVTSWIPATFAGKPSANFILIGAGRATQPIAIDMLGMQYNSLTSSQTVESSGITRACVLDNISLPIATMIGESCASSQKITPEYSSSPFAFYRPIFNIEPGVINDALKGFDKGVYTGRVPFVAQFYYFSNGILQFRKLSTSLNIKITYEPKHIRSIEVNGNGEMEAIYDTDAQRVSGDTLFEIEAKGYFDNGLTMTMQTKDYQLINETDNTIKIPYQVICNGCDTASLVDDTGKLIKDISSINQSSSVATTLNFSLFLKYDVPGEDLISGQYRDDFTILLEPKI